AVLCAVVRRPTSSWTCLTDHSLSTATGTCWRLVEVEKARLLWNADSAPNWLPEGFRSAGAFQRRGEGFVTSLAGGSVT
ncbi:MAG: hypothetical protein WBQ91_18650, partial [Candidatus Acidiferrum sp.]